MAIGGAACAVGVLINREAAALVKADDSKERRDALQDSEFSSIGRLDNEFKALLVLPVLVVGRILRAKFVSPPPFSLAPNASPLARLANRHSSAKRCLVEDG